MSLRSWISVGELLYIFMSIRSILSQSSARDETLSELRYDVLEELPVQTVVGNILTDSRLNEVKVNGVGVSPESWQFEILSETVPDLFSIDSPSGFLRIKNTTDRDAICFKKTNCSINLDIQMTSNLLIRLLRVIVNVTDANDNPPTFHPRNLVLNVSESVLQGTRIVLPTTAEDLDSGLNGLLHYDYTCNSSQIELYVENEFGAEGELYLLIIRKLDREETKVYHMQVVATDGGSPQKSGLLDIIIHVEDSNDNIPKFERDVYNVSIREDYPLDKPFVRVRAVDLDDGVNGQVVYSLARSSVTAHGAVFNVDRITGDIYLRQALDYRKEQGYVLSVSAMDSGPSAIPANVRLLISVIDVNDHAPTIKVTSDLQVPEGLGPGVLIGHVSVDDLDSGANGQVNCRLSHSEFLLEMLNSKIFKLTSNRMFDREEQEDYSITIQCEDNGEPSRSTTEQITVRITDVNDNTPRFSRDVYSVDVKENSPLNVPLMRVSARDDDTNDNALIDFSLDHNSSGLISIDPSTGIISTAGMFDYEERSLYEFTVTATDRGQPTRRSSTAIIVLRVVDFNDEAPVFNKSSYSFGTFENQVLGTEIGTVEASDRDTSPYDRFTFSIVQSRPAANFFQVDSNTGKIVSTRVLDREQYQVHHLVLAATNLAPPNPSSLVNVTISVADRNDNAPLIHFPNADNFTIELSADVNVGATIVKVIAQDADIGLNARLEYTIAKGNDRDLFELNPVSGIMTLKRHLPAQKAVTRHSLVLIVKDSGVPEKSASAVLDVYINKTVSENWTKHSVGQPSHLFNANIGAIFSFEVIIILSSVMAALVVILIVTIIYIRRRNRAVVDRNIALSPKNCGARSPNLPKYLVRKPEVCNNEYTYCAAESVDTKDDIAKALQLNSQDYKYDGGDDVERPRTHYTFAKVSNETAATFQGSLAREPLLSNTYRSSSNIPPNSTSSEASNSRISPPPIGDVEFHRLLEVLRRGESDSCECLSHCSTQSNLDSGRGPSETDIDHVQNAHNSIRAVLPPDGKILND